MDLRQLRYFSEVAAHTNFNEAARRLRVAQPALSRQVRKLEDELGVDLFVRVGRGVVLTHAGKLLVQHAHFLLAQAERSRDAVIAEATEPFGFAALGAPPSVGYPIFAPLAERYIAQFPKVTLRLAEGMTHSLLEWLRTGHIDIGIVTLPEPSSSNGLDKHLTITRRIVEDMLVFGPKRDRKLTRECDISVLAELPLIVTSRPNMARLIVEQATSAAKVRMNVKLEVESLQVMRDLVSRGIGYGIVPYSGLYGHSGNFKTSTIRGLRITRAVAYRSDRPPSRAVSELLLILNATIDDLSRRGVFAPKSKLATHATT
jgi:LysR family nitrogen assimilation transcriptional regulator